MLYAAVESLAEFGGVMAQAHLVRLTGLLQRQTASMAEAEAALQRLPRDLDAALRSHLHHALAATAPGPLPDVQLAFVARVCAVHHRRLPAGDRLDAALPRLMLLRHGPPVIDQHPQAFRCTTLLCLVEQDDALIPAMLDRLRAHGIDLGPGMQGAAWAEALAGLSATAIVQVLDHCAGELRAALAAEDGPALGGALLRALSSSHPGRLAAAQHLLSLVKLADLHDREAALYLLATATLYRAHSLCATIMAQGGFDTNVSDAFVPAGTHHDDFDYALLQYLQSHYKRLPVQRS